MRLFRIALLSLLAWIPFAAGHAEPLRTDDIVYAVSYYPNFEGVSEAQLFYVRGGVVSGPHASSTYFAPGLLLDDLGRTAGGVMFDREAELVVVDADGAIVRSHALPFPIAHFVLDATGSAWVTSASGELHPSLARVSAAGDVLWTVPFPAGTNPGLAGVTIDLARDQCTLWYSPATDGIGRYDVCRQVALPSIPGEPASRIRILPDGGALLALGSGVARVDAAGAVLKTWPYATSDPRAISISIAPDRRSFWVAEGASDAPKSIYYQVDLASDAILHEVEVAHPWRISAFAVYGEWRAATPPTRRRGVSRR
jgi:hypothetical protein